MIFRFGVFELSPDHGELRKGGALIRLSPQPSQVLIRLLEHPGEIVTREELRDRLWGRDDTSVEFDAGLNRCIRQIRAALNDDADSPRYIATVPRKGYRFVAPVEKVQPFVPDQQPALLLPVEPDRSAVFRLRRPRPSLLILAPLLLVIIFASAWFVLYRSKLSPHLTPVPLAVSLGDQLCPSFSPDGRQIAYVWNGEHHDNFDIYRKPSDSSSTAIRLTTSPDVDYSPAWSPDGHWIAFCRGTDSLGGAVFLLPTPGGPERKLISLDALGSPSSRTLAWSSDSSKLIVSSRLAGKAEKGLYLVTVESAESRRITTPVLGDEDMSPAVSPDGKSIAFTRDTGRGVSSIMMIPFPSTSHASLARQLTPPGNSYNAQPAWTPDSANLVFSSNAGGALMLRILAVHALRPTVDLTGLGTDAAFAAVSPSGQLAFERETFDPNIWKLDLRQVGASTPLRAVRVAGSTRIEESPAISPNGDQIAFESNRSGYSEIWISHSDGSNPVQITALQNAVTGSPDWSPDGHRIVFDSRASGRPQIYTITLGEPNSRQLSAFPGANVVPRWSADGQSVYYSSDRTGRMEIWQMPLSAGSSKQITSDGGFAPALSPDGLDIYYTSTNAPVSSLWRIRTATGERTLVSSSVINRAFAPARDGVYFVTGSTSDSRRELLFFRVQTFRKTLLWETEKPVGAGMALAPDGHTLYYTQLDQNGHELLLVKNFWSP